MGPSWVSWETVCCALTAAAFCCALAWPQEQPAPLPRIEPLSGATTVNMTFHGDTPEQHAQDLRAYFLSKYPNLDTTSPGYEMLITSLANKVRHSHRGTGYCLNIFDYNNSATSFNAYNQLAEALGRTKTPAAFQQAWKERYADLTKKGVTLEVESELARIASFPETANFLTAPQAGKLAAEIERILPEYARLSGVARKRIFAYLAKINPGLEAAGWHRAPKDQVETQGENVVIPLDAGRVHVCRYKLADGAAVLIPDAAALAKLAADGPADELALCGSVTERPSPAPEPNAANALAAGHDWPHWLGPLGRNSAAAPAPELVDSPANARQVWKSEEKLPDGRGSDARQIGREGRQSISGDYASPVVADGRVYMFYYVPRGDVYDQDVLSAMQKAGETRKEDWAVNADDIFICMDATTGRTVWKTRFVERGYNFNKFNKGGPQLSPCVRQGRIYAMGTAGRVYCVDAVTGAPLWESDIGTRAVIFEYLRLISLKQQRLTGFRSDLDSSPAVADGVVFCNTHVMFKGGQRSTGNGMIALDARTGRKLYELPDCLGWASSPLTWRHGGKEYVIAADGQKAVCVEPRTGKTLWKLENVGGDLACTEEMLVCGDTKEQCTACFRIDPQKTRRAWSLPAAHGLPIRAPVLHAGHAYVPTDKGQMLCAELGTGKLAGSLPFQGGGVGFTVAFGKMLLAQLDASHNRPEVHVFAASPPTFKQAGVWQSPCAGSYDVPIVPAYADGRLFVRARDGIVCLDLRKR